MSKRDKEIELHMLQVEARGKAQTKKEPPKEAPKK